MDAPKQTLAKQRASNKSPEKFKVFVATCQVIPDESSNDKSNGGAPINVNTPVFKQEKFPAIVLPSARIEDLQRFIVSQWTISKSPFAKLPLDEHFYTFKGRILRLDGTLDGYYILNNDTIYLRFASLGRICDPWAMSTSELRVELKSRNAYEINLQPEQLKQHFDYRYMCFEQDFLEMLTLKEEAGMVLWFRPQKSYEKLSAFLTSIEDPVAGGKHYQPLILTESRWLTLCGSNGWEGKIRRDGRKRDMDRVPKFTRSVARVVLNLQSGSFDYVAVKELLYQSNPTLNFAPL
ncbi:Linear gramicidin synthase subunit D [Phytophthora nicotianae]|uniref:Linear gramicidin synthase subunit D n=1 Tax=Phytophthora nicotianae TaxID=4792 RepID=A0A0W8CUW3_PHYNI|nr:Linear gramicidin synthase subunit D [Phytophthora nicotianae]